MIYQIRLTSLPSTISFQGIMLTHENTLLEMDGFMTHIRVMSLSEEEIADRENTINRLNKVTFNSMFIC